MKILVCDFQKLFISYNSKPYIMKKGCKSQISMEYIMIIAISLMILLPGVYFFRNFVFESNDQILNSRLNEISAQIVSKARKMHYYGPPSKSVLQIDMPPQVEKMYVLNLANEYYLVFNILTTKGPQNIYFLSEQKIIVEVEESCSDLDNNDCITHTCKCFPKRYSSKGIKNFRLESTNVGCGGETFCIKLKEISDEIQ